ncbi:hypothetical protein J4423_03000 [Candidatus Pacearchaeota archaeon]|nr:hypothetical protein [Candidatus Pacearchaeota archaeon]
MGDKPRFLDGKSIELKLVSSSSRNDRKLFPIDYAFPIWMAIAGFGLGGLVGVLAYDSSLNRRESLTPAEIIKKYDSNDDGSLSVSEFETYLRDRR